MREKLNEREREINRFAYAEKERERESNRILESRDTNRMEGIWKQVEWENDVVLVQVAAVMQGRRRGAVLCFALLVELKREKGRKKVVVNGDWWYLLISHFILFYFCSEIIIYK